ncbi:MAG: MFS transporter [Hungatella sp.]|nr:MFS transporter [Hungatella sp.]
MNSNADYRPTIRASYLGYVTQAVVNNLAPLLFLTFQEIYKISIEKITCLITINFTIQLFVDLLSAGMIDRIGYRRAIVSAHICSAAGIAGMAAFPAVCENAYLGLVAAVVLYAIGGGLIEVLLSPIVEACPTEKKDASMSLLHSFYCWGYVIVVAATALFFAVFGERWWRVLCILWAVLPVCNAFYFGKVPIRSLNEEQEPVRWRILFSRKLFWIFALVMVCAGASEQAMSQWASVFAESGLHVSKAAGDLAGPCMFAALMGVSRLSYAKFSSRISLKQLMFGSSVLCILSYIMTAFSSCPILGLAGCGLCGLSVGILWPGTFRVASKSLPGGGTAMFAFLALAGDLGCTLGPAVVGLVSLEAGSIHGGLSAAILFPVMLCLGIILWNLIKS